MELVVDLFTKEVALRDYGDLKRFSARAIPPTPEGGIGTEGGTERHLDLLAETLRTHAAGSLDLGGDVLIPPDAIRQLAEEAALVRGTTIGADWDAGFSSMLDYAASKEWMSEDGSVRVHVEWSR